ncbi:hypothetical protein DPMN_105093 [Dreissena polymorpha]|uniref:Uncharacterized protein n=1 Tax=Dreissena polymorpha TaxID=45954 RepID=A0A9D4HBP8_DREPO|nr:hypothetical protein DPMN_105093 [Dreissena polymorpha]
MSVSDVYFLMTKIHSSMTSRKKSHPMMKIDAFSGFNINFFYSKTIGLATLKMY